MALSSEQRARVLEEAKRRGLDPDRLVAAAEAADGSSSSGKDASAAAQPGAASTQDATAVPPLYQYHLPFVTVNEVRTRWLGLDAIPGGEEYAAKFAAAQLAKPSSDGSGA